MDRYDPRKWSDNKIEHWLHTFRNMDHNPPCERKHYDCSTAEDGPCMNHVTIVAEDRGIE